MSQAISAFFAATVELGVQNKVTTFTMSDFGRTFQPAGTGVNAVGTDHAWGNHQLIAAAPCSAARFMGRIRRFVSVVLMILTAVRNPRGRWIPTTSVEQYAATLANWYGLASVDLPAVFPLIGRFATSNLGFLG